MVRLSIGIYESNTFFTFVYGRYWSYQQALTEKKFSFDPKNSVGKMIFAKITENSGERGEPPFSFYHRCQCVFMYYQLWVSICNARFES